MSKLLENAISVSREMAAYDTYAKKIVSHKIILAYILVNTVEEFRGMNPADVVDYIEGEPQIGSVPTDPGSMNRQNHQNHQDRKNRESWKNRESRKNHQNREHRETGEKIVGLNTEDTEINEGTVRFDIIFYVRMRNGITQMIVDVELQKNQSTRYNIMNRSIFYVSRMISSQKNRDFIHSHYDDIKQVYSIWICLNMKENSLSHICLTQNNLMGKQEWKGNLNLMNIVMVGIAKKIPEYQEGYALHRLLGGILSGELTLEEKKAIIREVGIKDEDGLREDVVSMCNLSEGVLERGIEIGEQRGEKRGKRKGIAIGKKRGIEIGEQRGEKRGIDIGEQREKARYISNMYQIGFSIEDIAKVSQMSREDVMKIIKKNVIL